RPISFYALAGRDPEPNTTIRKEEATWSRTSSCRSGSEQFIQKENFPEFTYRLFVLWNRVIYTKLLTHPVFSLNRLNILKIQIPFLLILCYDNIISFLTPNYDFLLFT